MQRRGGGEHTGPGIRFICDSDAIDDPDNKGFWTTLALFRRLRRSLVWRGKLVCRRARRPDRDPNRRGSLNSNSSSCDTDPVASQWSSAAAFYSSLPLLSVLGAARTVLYLYFQ